MTPKRRRWHRRRYFLTPEPAAPDSVEFETKETPSANVAGAAADHQHELQAGREHHSERESLLKAKAAEAAHL